MAHFAEIDDHNMVIRVLVVPDEQEHRGQEFLAHELKLGGTWVQTSYNNKIRKQFAGIGYIYDPTADVFIAPQPAPWFMLDENFDWVCHQDINPSTGLAWTDDEIILYRLEKLASTGLDLNEVIGSINA